MYWVQHQVLKRLLKMMGRPHSGCLWQMEPVRCFGGTVSKAAGFTLDSSGPKAAETLRAAFGASI
jgi:hypothetical protein